MKMQPRKIIDRFMESLELSTQSSLAALLDVAPQRINEAIRRGKIPDAWLYKVAYLTGRDVDWLRTGEGSEFKEGAVARCQQLPPGPRRAILSQIEQYLVQAPDDELSSVQRLIEALNRAAPDVRSHLVNQLKVIERLNQYDAEHLGKRRRRAKGGQGWGKPEGKAAG